MELHNQHKTFRTLPQLFSSCFLLNSRCLLDARIILKERNIRIPQIVWITEPLIPRRAALLHGRKSRRGQLLPQFILRLQYLHREPRGGVPGDVAMDEPSARIIGFESDDNEATAGEEDDVPTGGIVEVEFDV